MADVVPSQEQQPSKDAKDNAVATIAASHEQQPSEDAKDDAVATIAASQEQQPSEDAKDNVVATIAEQNGELKKDDEPKTAQVSEEKKTDGEVGEASSSSSSSSAIITRSSTFKEESNLLSELKEYEKKSLMKLRSLLEDAIVGNTLFEFKKIPDKNEESTEVERQSEGGKEKECILEKEGNEEQEKPTNESDQITKADGEYNEKEKNTTPEIVEERRVEVDKDISLWGVHLLPSKGDTGTDVVLLKFLRAREFNYNEAFEMLRATLQWRKESKIDSILEEDFGADLNLAAFMSGVDREGHPVCYNVYGVFGDDEVYNRTIGDNEGCKKFLRWRSQLMERGIKELDFEPEGVSSWVQINDLKNAPGPVRKELRLATNQAVELLQDNYPELVARNIFINVPFWYYAFNALLSPFLSQRTKSKFVFARPAWVTETLLKYIAVEEIPVQYGGFKQDNESEFSIEDEVMEVTVKSGSTETIEIPMPEVGTTFVWYLTVLGWEVNYREEYVPDDARSYTLIVQKGRKMGYQEGSIRNSFTNKESGKLVLIVENGSFKRKRILYRRKTKNSSTSTSSGLDTA